MNELRSGVRVAAIAVIAVTGAAVAQNGAAPEPKVVAAVVGPYDNIRVIDGPQRVVDPAVLVDTTEIPAGFDPLSIPRGVQQLPWNDEGIDLGVVTSQADFTRAAPNSSAMSAADARSQFGVDGSGIRIGVISDSYDRFSGFAAPSVTAGDLPGVGNPNGYTTPVTVLKDDLNPSRIDEGRAMIELIHDLAPGAEIYFHSGFNNPGVSTDQELGFAIDALRAAGCDIIVDDLTSLVQPAWQDGYEANAYDVAFANGIACFTSAGNDANEGYQDFYNPVFTAGFTYHDFDANNNENPDFRLNFTIPANSSARPSLTWEETFPSISGGGNASDFDMYIFDSGGSIIASSTNSQVTGADPWEFAGVTNNGATDINVSVAFRAVNVLNSNVRFYFEPNSNGFISDDDDTNTGTTFASAASNGAMACAAIRYDNPTTVEDFSSRGNRIVTFDFNGNLINALRIKPDITGSQGNNNSFFGSDYESDGFPNFFGTSAAAPNVAAVAALGLELAQSYGVNLTPAELYAALEASTVDRGPAIEDGAGLLDAVLLLQFIEDTYGPVEINPGLYAIENSGQVLNVNTATAAGTLLRDIDGTAGFYPEIEHGGGFFYTIESRTNIVTVDPTTLTATNNVAITYPAPYSSTTALEYINGTLYAAISQTGPGGGADSALATINPATGDVSVIGVVAVGDPIAGLAWDGATLYGVEGGNSPSNLWRIGLTDGSASLVGQLLRGGSTISTTGLEFGNDGNLYGLTREGGVTNGELVRINKYTAVAAAIGPITGATSNWYNGITTVQDPGLYAIENNGDMFAVNPLDASSVGLGDILGDNSFYATLAYHQGRFFATSEQDFQISFPLSSLTTAPRIAYTYPPGFNSTTALESVGGQLLAAASVAGGNSTSSVLTWVDPATAVMTAIGNMGTSGPVAGLAWNGSTLYAVTGGGGGANLYTVDIDTGAATLEAPVLLGGASINLTGLAFGNDGVLYGLERIGFTTPGRLLSINPFSGTATAIDTIETGDLATNAIAVIPTFPQSNNDCYESIDIGLGTTQFDMEASTGSTGQGSCIAGGGQAFPDLFYRYTPNQNGILNVTVCGRYTNTTIGLQIYSNTTCPPSLSDQLDCVINISGGAPDCSDQFGTSVPVSVGDEILIRLTRNFNAPTAGEITLDLVFDGDSCADAVPIFDGVTPYGMGETTFSGLQSCFGIFPNLYYTYTASTTGTTQIDVCDSGPIGFAGLEIWTGGCGAVGSPPINPCNTTNTACSINSGLTYSFPTTAGDQFIIRLTTVDQAQFGEITINGIPDCVADVQTTNTNPGDPGYGTPDGTVDGADLSYFVENWLAQNLAVADVQTTNTNPGDAGYGQPDGTVDGADLSYFVEQWLAGCP